MLFFTSVRINVGWRIIRTSSTILFNVETTIADSQECLAAALQLEQHQG